MKSERRMAAAASHVLNITTLFLLFLFLISTLSSYSSLQPTNTILSLQSHFLKQDACKEFSSLPDSKTKCSYLQQTNSNPCDAPEGFIDYFRLFYCLSNNSRLLAYTLLSLSLLLLFYLLANTASVYFCSSLHRLSSLLSLPPTVAGVTLLSLGNGAPDVFSTLVSGGVAADVGLSTVLGGSFFVTTVVVASISFSVSHRSLSVDRFSFLRDLAFLLSVLLLLLVILISGQIRILTASLFLVLYAVYVITVALSHPRNNNNNSDDRQTPLLSEDDAEANNTKEIILTNQENDKKTCCVLLPNRCIRLIYHLLSLPLSLPRRLTIPDVSEERWCRPFAVASATFAPVLLAGLWATRHHGGLGSPDDDDSITMCLCGGLVGLVLGVMAFETTESSKPPNKLLLLWLAGGFLMSVVWTYIVAAELVSLLVAIGQVLGVSASVLAVTVLAWGNSIGDLIANVAMAINGGEDGAQVAISGCYAGPIFNMLVGLGLSLLLASWGAYPDPYLIPRNSSLFMTLGFLIAGLLWAVFVLVRREMRLDRVLGVGLVAVYLCFLCLRVSESMGLLKFGELFR